MHAYSNTEFQNLIPVITSNVSSNRIKIQEILLILQLETDYFSKLFISEMLHSKTFQSFMTFQPSRQSYNVPVSPGNPPHSSILRLECIFYSSIGFHRKLHRVPVGQLQTLHSFFKEREMLRYRSN